MRPSVCKAAHIAALSSNEMNKNCIAALLASGCARGTRMQQSCWRCIKVNPRTIKHLLLRHALYSCDVSLFAAQQILGSFGIHI